MARRKFAYTSNGVKDLTRDEDRSICDAMERSTAPFKEGFLSPSKRTIARWPIHSEAMAVDAKDIPRAQEILRRHGVRTEYDRIGRPILRDQRHRKAHARAMGFYDRNAGYGDPEPLNR